MSKFSFLYVTVPNPAEAESIGRTLLEEKLAACINILPGMKSVYWWEGNLESSEEVVLLVKTSKANVKKTVERISALHPYECPCAVEIPLGQMGKKYEAWLSAALRVTSKKSRK